MSSANAPVVIYNDAGGKKFNTRSGGTWSNEETISTNTTNFQGNKIVVDSADNYHVIWIENIDSSRGIKYRKRTSGVWGTEQIVISNAALPGYEAGLLGIDSSNAVYVVYQPDQDSGLGETIYYKIIASEIVGIENTLDSTSTQPDIYPSPYAMLYHRFPSSGIPVGIMPACLILSDNGSGYADVYYLATISESEDVRLISIGFTTLHYTGEDGKEYVLQGTAV